MLEGLMKAIDIIDKEQEYAKEVNPIMYLGMEQIKKLINKEIGSSTNKEISFGEKQRIDLARFLVKDYDVLIFDEPTNHLDIFSKAELYESIQAFPGSVILVTHEEDFYDGLVDLELKFEE